MIIITDILKGSLDEGSKIATLNLLNNIKKLDGAYIISLNSDCKLPFIDSYITLNKLLIDPAFYRLVKKQQWQQVLYIPESSTTLLSFVRARLLMIFTGKAINIMSLQPRTYGVLSKFIVRILATDSVITQSRKTASDLSAMGIVSHVLPLGVDDRKYCEFDESRKNELRNKYEVEQDREVVLHVGHIQQSRNLEWLISIKEKCPDVEVIMVGSTYNSDDEVIYSRLVNMGVRVIRDFIVNMEEIYNIADYYVFPVQRTDGAIGTPLSVLEAIACNLPVISTRFGSLADVFEEDRCLHFVDDVTEIVEIINRGRDKHCSNRNKIKSFIWENVSRQLIDIIN